MTSNFRVAIEFFDKIGIYDVVLPFLLVFTIVFAILEKTKVFGTETVEDKEITKKNLNSMAAFVMAFLVVASSKLVETITEVSSQVVVLLLLSVFFLLLVGSFFKQDELPVFLKEGGWRTLFMLIMFVGIVGVFLAAIENDDGDSWLEWGWEQVTNNFDSTAVASIILIIVIIVFMVYVVKGESSSSKKKEEKKEK
jgi:mannitol-specific phosphotransferase system IIBC component